MLRGSTQCLSNPCDPVWNHQPRSNEREIGVGTSVRLSWAVPDAGRGSFVSIPALLHQPAADFLKLSAVARWTRGETKHP